jgi:acylphosphatase
METKTRARVVITGSVQGVFFRMETKREADRLGVCGWVRNRPDGSVEAVLEGDTTGVDAMLTWCRQGPPLAAVAHVAVAQEPYRGEFSDFAITFG